MRNFASYDPFDLDSGLARSAAYGQGLFDRTLRGAYRLAGPEGFRARSGSFRRSALARNNSIGRRRASLARSRGASPESAAGYLDQALNDANRESFAFDMQASDPLFQARSALDILGMFDQGPAYKYQQGRRQVPQEDEPTFLESLLGIGGVLGGFF